MAWAQLLLGTTVGTQKRVWWCYSLHFWAHCWLCVWAGRCALLLWSASSTQSTQLSPSKEADGSWDKSHPWRKSLGFTEVELQLHSSQGSGPWLLICIAICSATIVSC